MSTNPSPAFIRQYESEAHIAYQRMGSKMRNTVRSKSNVKGESTTFQKVGKGTASIKARHGKVPPMSVDHTPVVCGLTDYYAGDYVDKLDELKLNIDERQILVNTGAYALGRKTDELIIAAATTSTVSALDGSTGMTKAKALKGQELLGAADVPDDGDRYAFVGWRAWGELLDIDEFANADYVGPDELPWKGVSAKRWLGTLWMPHSGLNKVTTVRTGFWWHKSAIGHASGSDIQADITWQGDHAAHFVNNMMSQGACLIDTTGVVKLPCLES